MIIKKFNRKTINLILVYSVSLAFTTQVNAQSIAQLLEDKFNSINDFVTASNSSANSAFSAQGRKYYVGGSASIRIPNPVVQPVAITLPSFKAGCEGVDMHLGSIDFASFDEYKKIWQALPKQAAAYAMQLGLSQISAIMGDTFKTVQDVVNKINSGTLDACALMKTATDGFRDDAMKMKSVANSFVKNYSDIKTSMEGASDKFSKLKGTSAAELLAIATGNGNSNVPPGGNKAKSENSDGSEVATPEAPELILQGNILWEAMKKSGIYYSDDEKMMIMSLVGTIVLKTDPEVDQFPRPPTIDSFEMFVAGAVDTSGASKLKVYECALSTSGSTGADPDCLTPQVSPTPVDQTFLKLTEKKMNAIKDRIISRKHMDAATKTIVQQIQVPIYRLLTLAVAADKNGTGTSSGDIASIMIEKYKKIVAIEYAQIWLKSALKQLSVSMDTSSVQYKTHANAYLVIQTRLEKILKEAEVAHQKESATLATADTTVRDLESLSKSLATNMPANLKKFMAIK